MPMGLKLLSTQGTGTYDSGTGIWSVGVLPAGDNATMELTLQVNNVGYFVNTATVIGDLHAAGVKSGLVKAFGVKAASTGNSQASYTFTATTPAQTSGGNNLRYDFPPVTPQNNPSNKDKSNSGGPGPGGPGPGGNGPGGDNPGGNGPGGPGPGGDNPGGSLTPANTQLARDIAGVRGAVTSGNTEGNVPNWNLTVDKPKEEINKEDPPLWLVGLIIGGVILGTALVITPAGEYLKSVIMGQLGSLSSMIMASSWFTGGKYLLESLGTHLLKFANNIAFNSASTEGFWFNIIGYLATLASPDIFGILGTFCAIMGIALNADVFALVGTILTIYGFYTLVKKYIFGE
ncbi:MAG TPA: hypothetical protein VHO92_01625 [Methanobacterium sp.]|nr:hypothetical protein [Methanobacterium sp.]